MHRKDRQVRLPWGCLQVALFPGLRLPAPALRANQRRGGAGLCVLGLHSPQTTVKKTKMMFKKFRDLV